jgi:hypothetical protein
MGDILKSLIDAPISTVLVLAGIAFMAVAIIGGVTGKFEPGPIGRLGAAVAGTILLVFGLVVQWPALYQVPEIVTRIA